MKVLLAPSQFLPHRGGVEEATLKLAQHLQAGGDDVLVLTNRHPEALPRTERVEGLEVVRLPFRLPGRHPRSRLAHARSRGRLVREVGEIAAGCDLVHVHCPSAQLEPVATWARASGTPLVITSHGETEMDAGRLYQRSRWMRTQLQRRARDAAALTSCSVWTATAAARIAPGFATGTVIGNGVDAADWAHVAPPGPEPVVAVYGRHVPQKGFDRVLACWGEVLDQVPGARLLVGGSGEQTASLRAAAGPGVTFLGPLDRAGVADLLGRARVVVVPSRVEPFGIVAVEALAAGRGLVYAAGTGLSEAAGPCGVAVDCSDARQLADAIAQQLRTPTPSAVGRSWARQNTWESAALRYRSVYMGAVASYRG